MEQFFKLTQHIILEKNSQYKVNSELFKKCKELDNLIEKRFVFENKPEIDEYKAYNTKVKYLLKNFFYKKIKIYKRQLQEKHLTFDDVKKSYKVMLKDKAMKKKMYHSFFPKQIVLMYNILGQCIFQSHCLTVLSTFPIYRANQYHWSIYNICLEIDKILETEEYKEIYYYILLKLLNKIIELGEQVSHPIEEKLIHSKEYKDVKKTQKFILDTLEECYSQHY
jgi:hypothetical protein